LDVFEKIAAFQCIEREGGDFMSMILQLIFNFNFSVALWKR